MTVPVAAAAQVLTVTIQEAIRANTELKKCRMQEETKRAAIEAELEARMYTIKEQYHAIAQAQQGHHEEVMEILKVCSEVATNPNLSDARVKMILEMQFEFYKEAKNRGFSHNCG